MTDDRDALLLELIDAYESLVSELTEVYFLHDHTAIDLHGGNVARLIKRLGIVWQDGVVQWGASSREE